MPQAHAFAETADVRWSSMSHAPSAVARTPPRTLTATPAASSSTNRSASCRKVSVSSICLVSIGPLRRWRASSRSPCLSCLFSLTDIPPNLVGDEADNLLVVYRIMADIGPGFFELDWKPQPAFSMYMMGWFMGLFGETIAGMRLPSVVLSTVSILVFYAVARQHGVGRPASLGATFLLATGVWYLHFSRSGWGERPRRALRPLRHAGPQRGDQK